MHHYLMKVSTSGEMPATTETVISRLEYFNNRRTYLLFESGDESEKRFILVSDKKATKTTLAEMKDIFETAVSLEEIDIKAIDPILLQKIHIAKQLMTDNDFCGRQKTRLVTDNASQLLCKANDMIGFGKFKTFLAGFADYMDHTADMHAKSLYNVVFINRCAADLEAPIGLLYGLYAAKGLLMEYVMIRGDRDDAWRTEKETRCVYVIEDEWQTDDGGSYFRASDEVKLLQKIRRSDNIYITAMSQEDYDKMSMLDSFCAAFPNVVEIDELSIDEKLAHIDVIAEEYGFSVQGAGFRESRMLRLATMDRIEIAVRKAIQRKLVAKDHTFCLTIADLDVKVRKKNRVSAFDELESLVGLVGVKTCIREIVTFLKKRGRGAVPCLHMAFLGNPGTGKTSVARIIARIFAETGITEKNLLVETDRGGLVGLYVGHTADKTASKIKSAMGGVLFIDEAYSLCTGEESKIDYGHEAVATLVKAMEDRRDEFVCILAGYTKEMDAMLDMNPGLRDRIQFYIEFPDYDEAELMQIFEQFCKSNKYRLSASAKAALTAGFAQIVAGKSQNFSNGRLVRKIFERVRIKQALRASNSIIEGVDIEAVLAERDVASLSDRDSRIPIGFRV